MRACGCYCQACHLPESGPRNAQAQQWRPGCCAGNHACLWLNRIPLETGAAAPRIKRGELLLFLKASTRRGMQRLVFMYMDRGPTNPHAGAHT